MKVAGDQPSEVGEQGLKGPGEGGVERGVSQAHGQGKGDNGEGCGSETLLSLEGPGVLGMVDQMLSGAVGEEFEVIAQTKEAGEEVPLIELGSNRELLLLLGRTHLLNSSEETVEGIFHVGGDMQFAGEGEPQFEGLIAELGAGGGQVAMGGRRGFDGGRGRDKARGIVKNAGEPLQGHQGAGPLLLKFVKGGFGSGEAGQGQQVEEDQKEGQETRDEGQAEGESSAHHGVENVGGRLSRA